MKERVPETRLSKARLQPLAPGRAFRKVGHGSALLETEGELQLAELVRLEAAGGLEALAKAQELQGRHRLEDVELGHHDLQDGEDPLQRMKCGRDGTLVQ